MSLVRKWAVRIGTVFALTQGIFTNGAVVNNVLYQQEPKVTIEGMAPSFCIMEILGLNLGA